MISVECMLNRRNFLTFHRISFLTAKRVPEPTLGLSSR